MGLFDINNESMEITAQLYPGSSFWKHWVVQNLKYPSKSGNYGVTFEDGVLCINNSGFVLSMMNKIGFKKYFPQIEALKFSDRLNLMSTPGMGPFDMENIKYIEAPMIYLNRLTGSFDVALSAGMVKCYYATRIMNMDLSDVKNIYIESKLTYFDNCKINPDAMIYSELNPMLTSLTGEMPLDIQYDIWHQILDYQDKHSVDDQWVPTTSSDYIEFEHAQNYSIQELMGITTPVKYIHFSFNAKDHHVHIYFYHPGSVSFASCFTKDGWSTRLVF